MKKLVLFLALIGAAGCSPRSVEEYNTASSETDTVRLLNQREYGKVIWLIESRDGKLPTDNKTAFLLGQAYLGKAGFEPLKVATAVGDSQNDSAPGTKDILPACPNGQLGPLKNGDPLCLLKRVYFQVPDPDLYEMARARELLRYSYPDPAATPPSVNVLIGTVELAGVIKRAGAIFLLAKRTEQSGEDPEDEQLHWLARQLKETLDEADQTLNRADHTGNLISQVLTGNGGDVWFDRAHGVVNWAKKSGLGNLIDVFRQFVLSPDEQAKYGPALEKIRSYLDDQNTRITAAQ